MPDILGTVQLTFSMDIKLHFHQSVMKVLKLHIGCE